MSVYLDNMRNCFGTLQVYTCVAATVSTRTLSRAIVDVHDLQHELYGVCDVNVTEATPDICILHGSWLDIAKAKRHIGQVRIDLYFGRAMNIFHCHPPGVISSNARLPLYVQCRQS